MGRIHNPWREEDFSQLLIYSIEEFQRFINQVGEGKYKPYESKLIAICLCQGGAQHYIDHANISDFDKIVVVTQEEISNLEKKSSGIVFDKNMNTLNGIQDIDVWFFFEKLNDIKMPDIGNLRIRKQLSFSSFGIRSVDFLKKSIKTSIINKAETNSREAVIRSYLNHGNTSTSDFLKQKSVIGLYPKEIFMKSIWRCKRVILEADK